MSFNLIRVQIFALLCLVGSGHGTFGGLSSAFGQEAKASIPAATDDPRIDKLAKLLTGSRWMGQFTTTDQNGKAGAAKEETYEISKAEKLPEGNLWLLTARIKYGQRDVTVPLPIDIIWAGDTPVITVNQLLVPGLGTFDARVLIRDGKYSGTWTHNDHGGHLFGSIGKMKKSAAEN